MARFAAPSNVDPADALVAEVHRTAGHVAWLAGRVARLEADELVRRVTTTLHLPNGHRRVDVESAPSTWVELYQRERDLLRRASLAAIQAGVAEWQVRVAEEQAQVLVDVLRGVLADLGVDPGAADVRAVVRRHLERVDGDRDE